MWVGWPAWGNANGPYLFPVTGLMTLADTRLRTHTVPLSGCQSASVCVCVDFHQQDLPSRASRAGWLQVHSLIHPCRAPWEP